MSGLAAAAYSESLTFPKLRKGLQNYEHNMMPAATCPCQCAVNALPAIDVIFSKLETGHVAC